MKIQLLNKIAKVGLNQLGDKYEIGDAVENPEGILVRSAVMHEMAFGENLLAVARAGAGVNNIPLDVLAEKGVVVFNTPGANANGVKELAVCALFLASRNIVGGVKWAESLAGTADVAKQVEKGKSQFAGTEVAGKTLGVIGLGAIGAMIANTALSLGMSVVGCDPFLSVDGAWRLDPGVKRVATFDDVFAVSDYVTLHVPATKDTKNMVNAASIAKMKDGVKIINLARADLVSAADLKEALAAGKVSAYVTDFPTDEIVGTPKVVTIPHLGASTEESEDNCAVMAAQEIDDYLTNGNIKNSVNYPNLVLPRAGAARVCVLSTADAAVLPAASAALDAAGVAGAATQVKGTAAYTIIDVNQKPDAAALSAITAIPGVRKVRVV